MKYINKFISIIELLKIIDKNTTEKNKYGSYILINSVELKESILNYLEEIEGC